MPHSTGVECHVSYVNAMLWPAEMYLQPAKHSTWPVLNT